MNSKEQISAEELLSALRGFAGKTGPEILKGLSGIYELTVIGEKGFAVHAVVSGGRAAFGKGGHPAAICSAETDPATLGALLRGGIRPAKAVMSGKIRVKGRADGLMKLAALLRAAESGISMECLTSQPGIQVYTGGKKAIALETQHWPDGPNHPDWASTALFPGETYRETTVYRFF